MKRALLVVALATTGARADVPINRPTAIEVDRDSSPPGRPELGFDGGAPLDGGWAASLQLGYLDRPLAFVTADGTSYPVERRQTVFLGAAAAIGPSAVVDLRMPLAHQTGDRLMLAGGGGRPGALDRWVQGDLRLGLRLRVVDRPAFRFFARGELGFPTGDERDFAGDSGWSAAWSLIGRLALPADIAIAASGGIRLRGDEVIVADRIVSNELFGAIGAVVPIPVFCETDVLALSAEVAGVLGDEVAGADGPSPIEARAGVLVRPRRNITIGVRAGAGLVDDEIGAPRWRAMVELTLWGDAQLSSLLPEIETEDDGGEPEVEDPEPLAAR